MLISASALPDRLVERHQPPFFRTSPDSPHNLTCTQGAAERAAMCQAAARSGTSDRPVVRMGQNDRSKLRLKLTSARLPPLSSAAMLNASAIR